MAAFAFIGSILDARRVMAVRTLYLPMLSLQRKSCLGMIEIPHAVHTIVAAQAVSAEILNMCICKLIVMFCVAILAGLVSDYQKRCPTVALRALHRCGVIILLVPDQAEIGFRMVEQLEGSQCWIKIAAMMFWVAGSTFIDRGNVAMRTLSTLNLFVYIYVTFQAFSCQVGPQWVVAFTALLFEICM